MAGETAQPLNAGPTTEKIRQLLGHVPHHNRDGRIKKGHRQSQKRGPIRALLITEGASAIPVTRSHHVCRKMHTGEHNYVK